VNKFAVADRDKEFMDLQAEVARWKALGADSPEAMAKLLVSQRLCEQLREQLLKDSEAEAEIARLREALESVTNYFWGTETPVLKEGDVQELVEAALAPKDSL